MSFIGSPGVGATVEISEIEALAKGSTIVGDGAGAPSILAGGSTGQAFTFDSAEATGVKWSADRIVGTGEGGTVAAIGGFLRAPDIVAGGLGNIAGADLIIAPGLGSGIGDPGILDFQLPIVAAAGDNIQTLASRLTLDMAASTTVLTMAAAQALTISTAAGDLALSPAGSVGIGTASPDTPLEISGTGNQFLRVTSTDDSQTGIELFRPDNADTDWRILNDGGSLFFKSSSDDFSSTSPKMAIRVGGDALFDSTTVDISLLQIRVIRASNTAAQGMGIGFVHDTSNGNVGAAIVHERTGSNSQGKLHFATKSSTSAAVDIPIGMTIDENGLVGIGTVTPTSILSFKMGTGSGQAQAGGKANVQTTDVGTDADTAEKDLLTFSLPANSLSTDEKLVKITAWGSVATNGNTKTIRLKFGATILRAIGPAGINGLDWRIDGLVIRTGAATQEGMATEFLDVNAQDTTISTPTETLSGAVVIKVTGQNGTPAANDIVAKGMLIEYLN